MIEEIAVVGWNGEISGLYTGGKDVNARRSLVARVYYYHRLDFVWCIWCFLQEISLLTFQCSAYNRKDTRQSPWVERVASRMGKTPMSDRKPQAKFAPCDSPWERPRVNSETLPCRGICVVPSIVAVNISWHGLSGFLKQSRPIGTVNPPPPLSNR